MRAMRLGVVVGTRPEAIKLAPVVRAARAEGATDLEIVVISTAQHRDMLDPILVEQGIRPDHDLDVMRPDQHPEEVAARVLQGMGPVLEREPLDALVVQGDTTTAFAAALAAFYRRLPVMHVEAGLRSFDPDRPFPEEMNRCQISRLAQLHFAPTEGARANLLAEGVPPERIHVTGNTAVDAVLRTAADPTIDRAFPLPDLDRDRELLLVTTHRRESFGKALHRICDALEEVLRRRPGLALLYPVHRNGRVREVVEPRLGGLAGVHLVEPLDHRSFVAAMRRARLILSDSGGVQEEAPSLGIPVLVLRDLTERPEGGEAGSSRLVGTDRRRIVDEVLGLLDDPERHRAMARAGNPYGDGQATDRILAGLRDWWARRPQQRPEE